MFLIKQALTGLLSFGLTEVLVTSQLCAPVTCNESSSKSIGDDFILVVPGIRPHKDKLNDQKRVMTPKEAISLGADLLVIGRPITNAENQIKATKEILNQIK